MVLLILILANAFFAASEIAVITLNDNRVKKQAEEGNKKARSVLKLTENSSRFLATIQVGVTLSGFLASASAAENFAPMLVGPLSSLGIPASLARGLATVVVTILISFVSLIFGELVPKKIAMQRSEQLAYSFAGFLNGVALVFRPVIALLTGCTNLVVRLFGMDPHHDETTVTEEEILMMVDQGEEKGVIAGNAKDMISNIFDFDDSAVGEAMTHRTDIAAVEDTDSVEDAVHLAMEKGFSRIPVYHEDLDNILGILYVKDLLKYIGTPVDNNIKLTQLMRLAHFVPETNKCSELFKEMTENHFQIAVIVDEYGGTEGLISLEDLIESIVGNIQDEYDQEEEEIVPEGENRWDVDGAISIDDVEDLTGIPLPEGDYDTLAGLLVELLGRIPRPGEALNAECGALTLSTLRVEERRIVRIRIEKHFDREASSEES